MLENALFALVRATLLAELSTDPGFETTAVKQLFQPIQVGAPSAPALFMQTILPRRMGHPQRKDVPGPDGAMVHTETQWWETTIQISATAPRDPSNPDFLQLPSAVDVAKRASDILQGDRGLAALVAQGVRPLRVTEVRNMHFVNGEGQYEANPSFDIVLSHVQIRTSTTPAVTEFVPQVGRV